MAKQIFLQASSVLDNIFPKRRVLMAELSILEAIRRKNEKTFTFSIQYFNSLIKTISVLNTLKPKPN